MNIERRMEREDRRSQRYMRDQFTQEEFPEEREQQADIPSDIYLFLALTSDDRMEAVIRCAVDLGVYEILPVEMKNSSEGGDLRKVERKRTGWQTLSDMVAVEEKRSFTPHIHRLISFAEALVYAQSYCTVRLVPYENETDAAATARAMKKVKPGKSVGIFIGPERGFSEEEISLLTKIDADPITLGRRVLRNDTAAICALYNVVRELEK